MEGFVQGWGLTVAFCFSIGGVFGFAIFYLGRELRWVRALTDHLGVEIVADEGAPATKVVADMDLQQIRDEAHAILTARDPAWAQKQVRSWQMRAQRLEQALAFWTDLLRQMGLLGTVFGLGLSLAYTGKDVSKLLGPLAFKVWTTVAGLAFSITLTALFGMKLPAWVDACEKNIEAWDAKRRARGHARPSEVPHKQDAS
ncbi:MAG: MotA/TolQ/ExbB proton channel family protein [Polyangiaceae bacterium]